MKIERILVPEFEIVSTPRISLADIKKRRYSLLSRFEGARRLTEKELETERILSKSW